MLLLNSVYVAGQAELFALGSKMPKKALNSIAGSNNDVVIVESLSNKILLTSYSLATLKKVNSFESDYPGTFSPHYKSFWHKTNSGLVAIYYVYHYTDKTLAAYSRAFSFDLKETSEWELIYNGTVINHNATPYSKPIEFYKSDEVVPAEIHNGLLYERGFDTIATTGNGLFYFAVRGENADQTNVLHVFGINENGHIVKNNDIVLPSYEGTVLVNSAVIHAEKLALNLVIHNCQLSRCPSPEQIANAILLVDLPTGRQEQKIIENVLGETGIVANRQMNLVYDQKREIAWVIGILSAKREDYSEPGTPPLGTEKIGFFQLGVSFNRHPDSLNHFRFFNESERVLFAKMSGAHIQLFETRVDEMGRIKTLFYAPFVTAKRDVYTPSQQYNARTGQYQAPVNSSVRIEIYPYYHTHELMILTVDTIANFKLLEVINRKACYQKTSLLGEKWLTLNGKEAFLFLDPYSFYNEKNRKLDIGDLEERRIPNKVTLAKLADDGHWEFQRLFTAANIELYPEDLLQTSENQVVGIGRKGLTRFYLFKITLPVSKLLPAHE